MSVCLAHVVAPFVGCYNAQKGEVVLEKGERRLFTHRAKTRHKPSSQLIIHLQTSYIRV